MNMHDPKHWQKSLSLPGQNYFDGFAIRYSVAFAVTSLEGVFSSVLNRIREMG
jgi:hypothetical protein